MFRLRLEGTDKVRAELQRRGKAMNGDLNKALGRAAEVVRKQAVLSVTDVLNQHPTGRLRSSIAVKQDRTRLEARVGTKVVYGPIHEYGGIIKPVKAKALAIPIGDYKDGPRKHKNLALASILKGQMLGLLVDKNTGKPQYVLRKSVRIPKRPWLRPAYQAAMPKIPRIFKGTLEAHTK